MNQIVPYLLRVGHAGDGQDFKALFDEGVRAVVQLAWEEPPLMLPRELILCRIPLADGPGNRPGLQGKTAIAQHWLAGLSDRIRIVDGLFLWSFYRGKDSDLCLRELLAYAEGLAAPPEVSASYCVDRLLPRLRCERWAVVLDGTEVVQHEQGDWFGRFVHPELGRLIDELASAPLPGV